MNQLLSNVPMPATWGDRRSLLAKKTAYALSFDLVLHVEAAGPTLALLSASTGPGKPAIGSIYHVLGQSSVTIADGSVREVPDSLAVVRASAQVKSDLGGEAHSLAGDVVFADRIQSVLSMTYTGTLTSSKAAAQALAADATGAVFIATKQDSAVPSLRWLAQRQLFGIGRMIADATPKTKGAARIVRLSFDLYTAA